LSATTVGATEGSGGGCGSDVGEAAGGTVVGVTGVAVGATEGVDVTGDEGVAAVGVAGVAVGAAEGVDGTGDAGVSVVGEPATVATGVPSPPAFDRDGVSAALGSPVELGEGDEGSALTPGEVSASEPPPNRNTAPRTNAPPAINAIAAVWRPVSVIVID
jgi:hypothetical protein